MPTTTTASLIVPEVIADLVETKLGDRITLLPLAVQDNSLQGQPGDTLKFPAFRYIGKADEVAENGEVTATELTSFATPVTVKKFAKAVQITDEARLSGVGDPVGEAAAQLAQSIDHAADDALFGSLAGLPVNRIFKLTAPLTADTLADALTMYGDALDGEKILLVSPDQFAALRKDPDYIRASDIGQRMINSGIVGEIWGCQILVSSKIKKDDALGETRSYVIKPGALRLVNKRGTIVEVEREAKYMRDTIFASKHCAAYLYDASKVIAASIFHGLQELAVGAKSIAGSASGTTRIVLEDGMTPTPAGYTWKVLMNTAAASGFVYNTAIPTALPWTNNETDIPAATNTYAHLALVDAGNKPIKFISLPIVKAP